MEREFGVHEVGIITAEHKFFTVRVGNVGY